MHCPPSRCPIPAQEPLPHPTRLVNLFQQLEPHAVALGLLRQLAGVVRQQRARLAVVGHHLAGHARQPMDGCSLLSKGSRSGQRLICSHSWLFPCSITVTMPCVVLPTIGSQHPHSTGCTPPSRLHNHTGAHLLVVMRLGVLPHPRRQPHHRLVAPDDAQHRLDALRLGLPVQQRPKSSPRLVLHLQQRKRGGAWPTC